MSSSNIDVLRKQDEILELVRKEPSHRNYWNVYKRIERLDFSNVKIPSEERISLTLMSSFTIDPLAIYLDIDCRLNGLLPKIYVAPFNRYHDEVLNKKSGLYKSQPDVVLFFIRVESLVEDIFRVNYTQMNKEHIESELDRIIHVIKQPITSIIQQSEALVIFSNFIIPTFSPFGILDNKQNIGFKRFYQLLNLKLEESFRQNNQVFIFDLNEVASIYGKDNYLNHPMNYRGSILFNESFLSRISYRLMGYIKALRSKNRKCIVLDLDNTLWGGIIGEDGFKGIKLNINYPGNEFVDFQRTILSLNRRGVILAINSKNNLEDALEVFQKHPYMQIRENNLAAHRINWNDKVQNLIELAKEINIGLDSIVFIDDNPVERARVQSSLPDVLVMDMPSSPALFRKTLEGMNDFDTLSLTAEDLQRSEMYYAKRKRHDLEEHVQTLEEFIKSLEIVVKIKNTDKFVLPRVASLLNRTNQFNLTTKRYTETEVQQMHDDPDKFRLYTLQAQDKFGDEGIVGIAIIEVKSPEYWVIDSFLLSCRVIGRKIETTFLNKIIKDAKYYSVEKIEAKYVPTKKNSLVNDFYLNHGFHLAQELNGGETHWILHSTDFNVVYPNYIHVVEE
ncbi:MAG: HAD family hydrolase [Candidatus Heimdallarchaeota archaeon]|nr:MAG: HAD family hydrolase [Candidatus Heimdallarchaeota archaeon]